MYPLDKGLTRGSRYWGWVLTAERRSWPCPRAGRVGRVVEETRIDRWLAAVRLVKTRPVATQLCEGGHVRVNGRDAKASTRIRVGDRVQARIADHESVGETEQAAELREALRIGMLLLDDPQRVTLA